MRLIDGDLLIEALRGIQTEFVKHPTFLRSDIEEGIDRGIGAAIQAINDASTIDAVPVVRCKDCKWYCPDTGYCNRNAGMWTDDDYCSKAEWRAQDADD